MANAPCVEWLYEWLYGAEAFYAYGYPKPWSSNSGMDRHDSVVVFQVPLYYTIKLSYYYYATIHPTRA